MPRGLRRGTAVFRSTWRLALASRRPSSRDIRSRCEHIGCAACDRRERCPPAEPRYQHTASPAPLPDSIRAASPPPPLYIHRQLSLITLYRTAIKVRILLDIAPFRETPSQKRSGIYGTCSQGISQFYLHTHTFIRNRNQPYLPSQL